MNTLASSVLKFGADCLYSRIAPQAKQATVTLNNMNTTADMVKNGLCGFVGGGFVGGLIGGAMTGLCGIVPLAFMGGLLGMGLGAYTAHSKGKNVVEETEDRISPTDNSFKQLNDAVVEVVESCKEYLKECKECVTAHIPTLSTVATVAAGGAAVLGALSGVKDTVANGISSAADSATTAVSSVANSAVNAVSSVAETTNTALQNGVKNASNTLSDIAKNANATVSTLASNITEKAQQTTTAVSGFAENVMSTCLDNAITTWGNWRGLSNTESSKPPQNKPLLFTNNIDESQGAVAGITSENEDKEFVDVSLDDKHVSGGEQDEKKTDTKKTDKKPVRKVKSKVSSVKRGALNVLSFQGQTSNNSPYNSPLNQGNFGALTVGIPLTVAPVSGLPVPQQPQHLSTVVSLVDNSQLSQENQGISNGDLQSMKAEEILNLSNNNQDTFSQCNIAVKPETEKKNLN